MKNLAIFTILGEGGGSAAYFCHRYVWTTFWVEIFRVYFVYLYLDLTFIELFYQRGHFLGILNSSQAVRFFMLRS